MAVTSLASPRPTLAIAQYSSWVRALNAYNFKKTRPGQWHHPHFVRDRPELLLTLTLTLTL